MTIKLKLSEPRNINHPADIFAIMQRVLLRESKIDRNREHVWTISLDTANTILNIELVSMGSINKVVIEPMEVFSVPLQKRAVSIILVHNHPAGQLKPSEMDKDTTDRLIQGGLILNLKILDHLIITEKSYYSFADSGLLKELEQSTKYVPTYKQREEFMKQMEVAIENAENRRSRQIAQLMKTSYVPLAEIAKYTGLTEMQIIELKDESTNEQFEQDESLHEFEE